MRLNDYEDSGFTCCECGCTFIIGYMSPENDNVCIFCDTDLDYEDEIYDYCDDGKNDPDY